MSRRNDLNDQGRTATLFTFSRKWSSPWLLIDTSLNQRLCLWMGTYVPVSWMAANLVTSKTKWNSLCLSNFNEYICIVSGNPATWGWSSCNQLALKTNKHGAQHFIRFIKDYFFLVLLDQIEEEKEDLGILDWRNHSNGIKFRVNWINKRPNNRKKRNLRDFCIRSKWCARSGVCL